MLRLFITFIFFAAGIHVSAQESSNSISSSTLNPEQQAEVNTSKPTAKQWLNYLRQLVTQNNFEARFVVYRAGQDAVPYLWRHALFDDGPDMEQLNLQNGPGKEFIRVGNKVSVFEPDTPPYTVFGDSINGPIPWALLRDQESLYTAYQFIIVGRSRVSGKPAKQIRIVSKDNSRYSYQLWLDEESGMLLKMNMLDSKGVILEQIQMLGFTVTALPHTYFARVNKDKLPRIMSMPTQNELELPWKLDYLPQGMAVISQDTRRLAGSEQEVEHKLFSDGLVDVSVYVEPAQTSLKKDIAFRQGVNTFLSRIVQGVQVTVIGEIPPETADQIATSIQRL